LLRRLRPYANGTPDHDRLGAVFAALDPEPFQKCFVAWVATLIGAPADVIAIDGKTSRRSYQKNRLNPIHMVSASRACRGGRPSTSGARAGQGGAKVQ